MLKELFSRRQFVVSCGFLSSITLFATSGCVRDKKELKLVPAHGRVMFKGKPLAGAYVNFRSDSEHMAMAVTDAQGRFELKTQGRPGAVMGYHQCFITAYPPVTEKMLANSRTRRNTVDTSKRDSAVIDSAGKDEKAPGPSHDAEISKSPPDPSQTERDQKKGNPTAPQNELPAEFDDEASGETARSGEPQASDLMGMMRSVSDPDEIKASIASGEPPPSMLIKPPPSPIPDRYTQVNNSGLEFRIDNEDENFFDIVLLEEADLPPLPAPEPRRKANERIFDLTPDEGAPNAESGPNSEGDKSPATESNPPAEVPKEAAPGDGPGSIPGLIST